MRYLHLVLALFAAVATGHDAWANDPDSLTQEDYESVAALRDAGPEVAHTLSAADAAYERAEWQKAAALYAALPSDTEETGRFPLRRRCQALTQLGRRNEALGACKRLLNLVIANAADLQATVAAMMLGSGRPSDSELRQVTAMSQRIENLDPDGAWSPAARCAIAERVADRVALEACTARLAEIAPEHRATQHFRQLAGHGSRLAACLQLGLFGVLLLGALLTLGHRLFARRGAVVVLALPVLGLVLVCAWSGAAHAQGFGIQASPASNPDPSASPTKGDEAESNDKELEDETKLLTDLTDKIKSAESQIVDKHDWPAAMVSYNEVVALVPYCGRCWRRLCEGYSYMSMPVEGAHACRQAIASPDGDAWDRAMLVHHLLTGPSSTKQATRDEAARTAAEAVRLKPSERWGYDALCEIALEANDLPGLKSCSEKLRQFAPDDRKTLALLFAVALAENRFDDAVGLIERGRKNGLDAPTVEIMKKTLAAKGPLWWRIRREAPLGLLAALVAAAVALCVSFLLGSRAQVLAPRA